MRDLGIKTDSRVPYFVGAQTVLLTKRKINVVELIAELDVLKAIVTRRAGKIEQPQSGTHRTEAAPGTSQLPEQLKRGV